MAKIGLVAYDTKSHELLGSGGVSSSEADDSNLFVFGIGPFQSGTAREELNSTTPLRMNQSIQPLPTTVAFNASSESNDRPERLQLTVDERTSKE